MNASSVACRFWWTSTDGRHHADHVQLCRRDFNILKPAMESYAAVYAPQLRQAAVPGVGFEEVPAPLSPAQACPMLRSWDKDFDLPPSHRRAVAAMLAWARLSAEATEFQPAHRGCPVLRMTFMPGAAHLSELDIRVRREDVPPALAWLHKIRQQAFGRRGSFRNATVSALPAPGDLPVSVECAVETFDNGLRSFTQVVSRRLLPGDTSAVRAAVAEATAASQRDRILVQDTAGVHNRRRA